MRERCLCCDLHFAAREQGDGPAFFGICFVGALATILAVIVEIKYEPPFWLHAILWAPFVVLGSLVCLRMAKAWLLGIHYHVKPDDFSN